MYHQCSSRIERTHSMAPLIVGLGGSLRPGSTTSLALRIALDAAQAAGAQVELLELAALGLPLFDGTYALDGYTSSERTSIRTLLAAVDQAHGFILASPTYHNTLSGAFKNALDFLDVIEPDYPSRLKGKVAGILT